MGRVSKLTAAARGMPCQIRVPFVCIDGDHSTTVLAHVRMTGLSGTGIKAHDLLGAWACGACHLSVDGASSKQFSRAELRLMHLEGVMRTIDSLIRKGLVNLT